MLSVTLRCIHLNKICAYIKHYFICFVLLKVFPSGQVNEYIYFKQHIQEVTNNSLWFLASIN